MNHGNRHRRYDAPHVFRGGRALAMAWRKSKRVSTPAGRMWRVAELIRLGQVTPAQYLDMLSGPQGHRHVAAHSHDDLNRWVLGLGDPFDVAATSEFTPDD